MKQDEELNMEDYIQNVLKVVDQQNGLGKVFPGDPIVVILLGVVLELQFDSYYNP